LVSFIVEAEVDVRDDSTDVEAEEAGINAAGFMSSNALDKMGEEDMDSMFAIDSSDSMANYGGSDTNLSLVRTFEFELSCIDVGNESNGIMRGGFYFEGLDCNAVNGEVSTVVLSWCEYRDGFRCDEDMAEVEVDFEEIYELGDSELSLLVCDGVDECSFLFVSRQSDNFDGSDLENEGIARDDAEGSYVFDLIEANENSEYYDDANKEVIGLQQYVDNNYTEMNETGMMGIYRNSAEDIAIYGERTGEIPVDNVAADTGAVCVGIDLNNLDQCLADYSLVEYVCDNPDDLVCSYERDKAMEYCSRTKIMSCQSKIACQTESGVPITNISSSNWPVTTSLNNIQIRSGNDNHLDSGYYESELSFNISDIENVSSFYIDYVSLDDMLSMHVNGDFVYYAMDEAIRTSENRWPVGYHTQAPGHGGWLNPSGVILSDGHIHNNDYGQTVTTQNINILPYLNDSLNTITLRLGVRGGGEADVRFKYEAYCGCNWTETWEEVCNATNY
jgi:hypothetical protein